MTREPEEIVLAESPRERGTLVDDLPPSPRAGRGGVVGLVLLGLAGLVVAAAATALWLAPDRAEEAVAQARHQLTGVTQAAESRLAAARRSGETTYAPSGAVVPGMVYVESTPAGAEVLVNGDVLGKTPLVTSHRLEGDVAEVELRREGYRPWHREAPVREGGLRLEVRLEQR